jgi:hypothetical protein
LEYNRFTNTWVADIWKVKIAYEIPFDLTHLHHSHEETAVVPYGIPVLDSLFVVF